ncbi:MAG: hypothetical protein WCF71_18120 [Verrucomicrobiia bacterium]
MNEKHPHGIGPAGRWYLYSGIPFAVIAVFFTTTDRLLDHVFSENVSPYIDLFVIGAIAIGALILYDHLPKRLVIPLGIVGWIISFSLLYWYFLFGPGAFGHHHSF